jgi:hypothetical protein
MGNQLMQSPSVMFTFTSNCHLGKTHGHRSRGDTTWEAQSLFSQSVSFVAVPAPRALTTPSPSQRIALERCGI